MANMALDFLAGGGLDAELDGSGRRRRRGRRPGRRVIAPPTVYVRYLAELEEEEPEPLGLVPGLDVDEDWPEGAAGVEGEDFYIDGSGKKKKKRKGKKKKKRAAPVPVPSLLPGFDPYAAALEVAPAVETPPALVPGMGQGVQGPTGPSFARSVDSGEPFSRSARSSRESDDFEAIGGAFQRDADEDSGAFIDAADFESLDAAPAQAPAVVETSADDDEMVFDVPEGSSGLGLVPGLEGSGRCGCECFRRYPKNYGLRRNP